MSIGEQQALKALQTRVLQLELEVSAMKALMEAGQFSTEDMDGMTAASAALDAIPLVLKARGWPKGRKRKPEKPKEHPHGGNPTAD